MQGFLQESWKGLLEKQKSITVVARVVIRPLAKVTIRLVIRVMYIQCYYTRAPSPEPLNSHRAGLG